MGEKEEEEERREREGDRESGRRGSGRRRRRRSSGSTFMAELFETAPNCKQPNNHQPCMYKLYNCSLFTQWNEYYAALKMNQLPLPAR